MNKTNLFDLDGKIAFVSGASRGIGEAIARLLAQQGAHVIVSSRKVESCEGVAEAIRAEGGQATAIGCHIGEMEQIRAAFTEIRERFGRLDILVNNAATNPQFGHVLDTDLTAFQKTRGCEHPRLLFHVGGSRPADEGAGGRQHHQRRLDQRRHPRRVPGRVLHDQAAVISMTKVFAKECAGLGIRCNALLPGLTDTKFASALTSNDAILKMALQRIPLKRVAAPSEMAGAVLYLASDASSYTTGVALNVDGGYLA